MNQSIRTMAQIRNAIDTFLARRAEASPTQLVAVAEVASSADIRALGLPERYNVSQVINDMVKHGEVARERAIFPEYPSAKYGYRRVKPVEVRPIGRRFGGTNGERSERMASRLAYNPSGRAGVARKYVIDSDIPLPPPRSENPGSFRNVVKRLEVGQSVLYGPSFPGTSWRDPGKKYATRRTEQGWRVWRIA